MGSFGVDSSPSLYMVSCATHAWWAFVYVLLGTCVLHLCYTCKTTHAFQHICNTCVMTIHSLYLYFYTWKIQVSFCTCSKMCMSFIYIIPRFTHLCHDIMPYYGLFSRDLHILDLWWRSPLCSLHFVDITPVCTTFMFHDSLWHHNGTWRC